MICAWKELLSILPPNIRQDVDRHGKDTVQELRFRLNKPVEMVFSSESRWLSHSITIDEMNFIVNAASRYSPWSAATMQFGYITAQGGHRIGLCGECVMSGGSMTGIRHVTSLCIRVARDFPGIAKSIPVSYGSCLILGPPGCGKTTLLRDLIRQISDREKGHICVVDERGELFPVGSCFETGKRTDVLTGCLKPQGIETALRTMGPKWIAVDEITAADDCDALLQACWCGVRLLATAHASCKEDLLGRRVYKMLVSSGIFETLIILQQDKSWRMERMKV